MSSVDRLLLAGNVAFVGFGVLLALVAAMLAGGAWAARGKYDFADFAMGAGVCAAASALLFTMRWVVFG